MRYSSHYIDVNKLPTGDRDAVVHLAENSNAFIKVLEKDVEYLKNDAEKISGTTEEDKENSARAVKLGRIVSKLIHKQRFNVGFAAFTLWLLTNILEKWGVNIKVFAPVINHLIQSSMT